MKSNSIISTIKTSPRFIYRAIRFVIKKTKTISILAIYKIELKFLIKSTINKMALSSKNKTTIVFVLPYLALGGVEKLTLNIMKNTDRKKFDIHIITSVKNDNIMYSEFKKYAKNIINIPSLCRLDLPDNYKASYIEKYISAIRTDIMFITNSLAAYKSTPLIRKNNKDIKIYDLLHTQGLPSDKDAYLRLSMPFDKYISKRLVISQYLKDYYLANYPIVEEKIYVIHNSIDDSSKNKKAEKDNILKIIPKDYKIITYVGRLEADKSPLRLVDLASMFKKQNNKIAILVVGDGSLKDKMINESINKNILDSHIYFFGKSDNPLSLAKHSDFTLLVSDNEGLPMCVLESMTVSTPSIAPMVGGIPEIIDNEIDGFLVNISKSKEEEKIKAFYKTIIKACSLSINDYKKMSQESHKKIINKFSKMPKQYKSLFETGKIINQ